MRNVKFIKRASAEANLPSTVVAMGGIGFTALAVSNDGNTIAGGSDYGIFIFPEVSIWIPSVELSIHFEGTRCNEELQRSICSTPDCKCKVKFSQEVNETFLLEVAKLKKPRQFYSGFIQFLDFYGANNQFIYAAGKERFLLYDLFLPKQRCILALDVSHLGYDEQFQSVVAQSLFHCRVLNITRNAVVAGGYKGLTAIELLYGVKPFVPHYYRILVNEDEGWYVFDCDNSCPVIPIDKPESTSMDLDVDANVDPASPIPTQAEFKKAYNISYIEYCRLKMKFETAPSVREAAADIFGKTNPYYACCLLKYYDTESVSSTEQKVDLNVVRDYIIAMWMPPKRIIMLRFTVESRCIFNKYEGDRITLSQPTSCFLTGITLSGAGPGKVSAIIPKPLGNVFCVMATERFYLVLWAVENANLDAIQGNSKVASVGATTISNNENALVLHYTHYDPVSKYRYTTAAFTSENTNGFFGICGTNTTNNWVFNILNLRYARGIDSIRLVLDLHKCRGFTQVAWVPYKNRLTVISGYQGELYLLQPKFIRNWAETIPNFTAIEKNIEHFEEEEEFDKQARGYMSPKPYMRATNGNSTKKKSADPYPFYHVGYAVAGEAWADSSHRAMHAFEEEPQIIAAEASAKSKEKFQEML